MQELVICHEGGGQVVIDLSKAASIADMRGSRMAVMSAVLQTFIRDFFDQNPLSHLGIIRMRSGVAERLTELSGSPVSPYSSSDILYKTRDQGPGHCPLPAQSS